MKRIPFHLAIILSLVAGLRAEVPPAEKLLPADTLAVVAVPDYAKMHDAYVASPQGQLWHDPAMKPFVDKFAAKLTKEFFEPLEKDLGTSLTNYISLLRGQLTFALVRNDWDGSDTGPQPGWLALIDTRDKSALLQTNLADLKHKWTDANKLSRTEKIRDVEFTILKLSTTDAPPTLLKLLPNQKPKFEGEADKPEDTKPSDKADDTTDLYLGQSGSLLIAGNQTNVLEKLLVAQSGGGVSTLAEQPTFEANRVALFRDAQMFVWVNSKTITDIVNKQLVKKAEAEADAPSFTPFTPEKIIGALGLDALKSIAFCVRNAEGGSFAEFFLSAPESERRGLLNMLVGVNKEVLPPEFVPGDTINFQRYRFDGPKTWDNLEKLLGNLSPQMLAGVNFAIEMAGGIAREKNPEYNLKKSLLGSLGDDFITYEKSARSSEVVDLVNPPKMTLVGTTKPDQMIEAVNYIATGMNRAGQSPKEREFLGRKIYSIELPPLRFPDGKTGPERALSFCAAKGYVAVTTDSALLEEFIRAGEHPTKTLRESAGLLSAVAKLKGSRPSAFSYENQAETMRSFLDGLKKNFGNKTDGKGDEIFRIPGTAMILKEWADVSLLPDFYKIAKYFHLTVSVSSASPEGITLRVFTPDPPQLKTDTEAKK